eukprot:4348749-Prymnesium_polylepis.1
MSSGFLSAAAARTAALQPTSLDAEDAQTRCFVRPGNTASRGTGLFATREVPGGATLFCEGAVAFAPRLDESVGEASLDERVRTCSPASDAPASLLSRCLHRLLTECEFDAALTTEGNRLALSLVVASEEAHGLPGADGVPLLERLAAADEGDDPVVQLYASTLSRIIGAELSPSGGDAGSSDGVAVARRERAAERAIRAVLSNAFGVRTGGERVGSA